MKKRKYSKEEKKIIRNLILFLFVQVLCMQLCFYCWNACQPIDINDTKQVDIIVDKAYETISGRRQVMYVVADSEYYMFTAPGFFEEYTVGELNDRISEGDHLSLIYYEGYSFFQKVNHVIDARSETEVFRSLENYYRGKQGIPAFGVIICVIIESLFLTLFVMYVTSHSVAIKIIYKKIRKRKTGELISYPITDEEAKSIILKVSKCKSVTEFQQLGVRKRNWYIKKLQKKGLPIRQISRLTGLTKKMVKDA